MNIIIFPAFMLLIQLKGRHGMLYMIHMIFGGMTIILNNRCSTIMLRLAMLTSAQLPTALLSAHYLVVAPSRTPTQPKEHELAPSHQLEKQQK